MGEIIEFPLDVPPKPFAPKAAVKRYLYQTNADVVVSFRIPREIKQALMSEAFESNDQFSRHVASIICEHLHDQGLHCFLLAGQKQQEEEKRAA
jgi:hypothetical protein